MSHSDDNPIPSNHRIRFKRLNQVCDKALSQSIAKLQNWEKLSSCYPEYISTKEGYINLKTCQSQVCEFWWDLCKQEFEAIFDERKVKEKLDELDDLILKARDRSNSNSGKGNALCVEKLTPDDIMKGNIQKAKKETINRLDENLETLDGMNKELQTELSKLNESINEELKTLEGIYDRWLGTNISSGASELKQGVENMLLEVQDQLCEEEANR
ncbi:HDL325Wp [Eremothecium sinecaudum]|uniref:Kinetochore-associated protein n=1 Tax=Eremothecium sinecaudum TaxID=45286 RepID=A0A0X8HS30_9SACH|nr:HDL325Wp [Eremothecium sinecaudum]AMD20419.1 HDL325Wp [Eremothecium sinecaudum]